MKKKAIHMKFLNHSIGFCLLLTLLCYSCASDYLDTAPTNQVSPADLFKDEAYAAYAVSGLEKLMKTTYPTNKLDGVSFNGEGSVKLMYAECRHNHIGGSVAGIRQRTYLIRTVGARIAAIAELCRRRRVG